MPNRATTETNRLRHLRDSSGESKPQIATVLGLKNIVQIERWEKGDVEIPMVHARVLARHFKVTLSYLQADEAEAA